MEGAEPGAICSTVESGMIQPEKWRDFSFPEVKAYQSSAGFEVRANGYLSENWQTRVTLNDQHRNTA